MAAAAASPLAWSRTASTTVAPAPASAAAAAWPMPLLAPVMITVFPARSGMWSVVKGAIGSAVLSRSR